jgi:uncharacterized protein (TIGR02145 family)
MKNLLPIPLLILLLFLSSVLQSQTPPQGIPFQAVLRNVDGSEMVSSAVSLTFMIRNGSSDGTIVYEESHSLTTNNQGVVSCVIGNGIVIQGNFSNINWGNGAKFLHVKLGDADLGIQRMMSVPYSLYTGSTQLDVSPTGDTLMVAGESFIVPGISALNPEFENIGGLGAQVLVGNTSCENEYISISSCGDLTSLLYDGRTYDLVEIGGQCWFADNLATDQYRNGDPIFTGLDGNAWSSTNNGAYAIYNNEPSNDNIYGKLYNWFATVDSRGLCPAGWHVPTDCDWMYLEGSLGMSVVDQQNTGRRGTNQGGAMKAITSATNPNFNYWAPPNTGANNSSGFTALPGGYRSYSGAYLTINNYGYIWSSKQSDTYFAWSRIFNYNNSSVSRTNYNKRLGFSVRCVRD